MSSARRTRPSRRDFLLSVGGAVGIGIFGEALTSVAVGKALPHVTTQDPQALALHYTEDATKIDAQKDPTHAAGAKCANCKLYQGSSADAFGPCQLYPGKSVSANGWCMGYQKKA